MPTNFTSPVGRLVQGDAFEPQLTDQQGKPRVVQSGPRAGQPAPQWFVALAFAKTDPAWPPFKALIDAECAQAWPSLFPQGPAGPCVLPTFSNKIIDGDGVDTTGKSNATKEGFAGHWIVRFTSGFAPKVYKPAGPGAWVEVSDKNEIKRGYYVRVSGTVVTNQNATKPGVHVNVGMVELNGQGVEIVSGPSAQEAFGAPAALPVGATALPASATPLPGGVAAPVVAPAPVATPPAPAVVAPPYTGYMAPPAPAFTMLPAAQGATYEAMIAAGWNDETLVANGMAVRNSPPAPAVAPTPVPPAPAPVSPVAAPPAPIAGPQMTAKAAGATKEAMNAAGWSDAQLIQHGYMTA